MERSGFRPRTLASAFQAVTLSALLWSCGSGNKSGSDSDSVIPPEEAVRIIESRPAVFDARSIEEMDRAIASGSAPGPEDMARMLVAAEAGVGHLQSMLDELARNEDPADTYGLLTELAQRPWTRSLTSVIRFLAAAPLSTPEHRRATALASSIVRSRTTVSELESAQLGGNPTGLTDILIIDTNQ